MIDLNENDYKQLIDKILSIMSDKYDEHFTIEKDSFNICVLTKARAVCFIKNTMFFNDEKHLLSMMMKYPLNFYDGEFDLKKELGSTLEEIMISCDLKAK